MLILLWTKVHWRLFLTPCIQVTWILLNYSELLFFPFLQHLECGMQFAVSQICNIVRYEKFKYLLRVLTVQSCANGCIYISSTALMKCNKKRVKTELRFISMWQQMLIDISYVLNPFSLIGVRFHVDFSCKFQWYWYGMGLFCFYGMSTESINRFRAENNKCQYTMMTVSTDFVVKFVKGI